MERGIGYITFRKKVLEKWNHRCVTCGSKKQRQLRIHHIKPLKESERHYTLEDIEECIVLCHDCHMAIHNYKSCKKDLKFHKEILFSLMEHHRQEHHNGTDKTLTW